MRCFLYSFPVALSFRRRVVSVRLGLGLAFRLVRRHGLPAVSFGSNPLGEWGFSLSFPGDAAWLDFWILGPR